MIEHITLPGGEIFLTDFNARDIYNVVSDFCGEQFAEGLRCKIEELQDAADYETQKFNSDMGAYEAENEEFRDVLTQIDDILQEYERNVENRRERFSRAGVWKQFVKIHRLIEGVI